MSFLQQQIGEPNQTANLNRLTDTIKSGLFVATIGRVIKYNTTLQTATIQPTITSLTQSYQGVANQSKVSYVNVPVVQPCGDDGGVVIPIKKSDLVLLIFCDRSIDNVMQGFLNTPPKSARMHHEHDAIAIPFVHNKINALVGYDNASTIISFQKTFIKLASKISMKNTTKDFWTVLNDTMTNMINTADYLSKTASQLSALANALATAQTINAVVGLPLTMDTTTIANATAVKIQSDEIKANVDIVKNNLTQDKTDFGGLFENG